MAFSMGKSAMPQNGNFEVIDIEKMCEGGLFREQVFREQIRGIDWKKFAGKDLLVKGCGNIPIPTWAYMLVAAQAARAVKSVAYGESAKPITVFKSEE